jgi:hypothetical protein
LGNNNHNHNNVCFESHNETVEGLKQHTLGKKTSKRPVAALRAVGLTPVTGARGWGAVMELARRALTRDAWEGRRGVWKAEAEPSSRQQLLTNETSRATMVGLEVPAHDMPVRGVTRRAWMIPRLTRGKR